MLTPTVDDAEWDSLTAWLDTARLPTEPYRLNRATLVVDPALSHRRLRDAVARGPAGQARRALLVRMRKLKEMTGANDR